MEITRQADYYGLDAPERAPVPPAEHLADVLKAPTPWQGPMKVEAEHLPGLANPVRPVAPLTTQGSPTPAVQPETERVNQSTEIPAGGGRI